METPSPALYKMLNKEDVRGRDSLRKNWAGNTVGRILANKKYIGKWVWNKTECCRDPETGRRHRFPKPELEWALVVMNH